MSQPISQSSKNITRTTVKVGTDCIGVGVGACILNHKNEVLLALRGPLAKNERGTWEIPGGAVEFGETLQQALHREIKEELGIEIEILDLLQICDHILPTENQHWVSPTYLCRITSGEPTIREPGKCAELRWCSLSEAQTLPLSQITQGDIRILLHRSISSGDNALQSAIP